MEPLLEQLPPGQLCARIYAQATVDYHRTDNVDSPEPEPYAPHTLGALLYKKNWVDAVQWHLEDLIRDPQILPAEALALKRRIDASNQRRTDLVEQLDQWIYGRLRNVQPLPGAPLNTETPAWAMDRLSVLELKIYHMRQESEREAASPTHRRACAAKLEVLLEQENDLTEAISRLLAELQNGTRRMKLYLQMKMYNDPELNPVLYKEA